MGCDLRAVHQRVRFRGLSDTVQWAFDPVAQPCFKRSDQPGAVGMGLANPISTIQATETVKLILGIGRSLSGRLLLIDALDMDFRTVKLRRNPECPLCGDNPTVTELIDYEMFCGMPSVAL